MPRKPVPKQPATKTTGKSKKSKTAYQAPPVPPQYPELGKLRETYVIDSEGRMTEKDRKLRWELLRVLFGKKRRGPDPVHDLCFFMAMSDPEFVKETLLTYFPELAEELDLDQITAEPATFLNRLLERKIADLIFSIPLKNKEWGDVKIRIVIEHKAQGEKKDNRRTIMNLVEYVVLATKEGMKSAGADNNRPIPQAIAIVFYTGGDVDFDTPVWEEYFKLPGKLGEFSLKIKIPCVNLTRLVTEDKLQGSPIVRAFFSAMAYAGLRTLKKNFGKVLKIFNEIKRRSDRVEILYDMLVAYIFRATENVGQTITEEEFVNECNKLETREMKEVIRPLTNWLSEEEKTALREEGSVKILRNLVDSKLLTPKQAAEQLGLTVSQFKQKEAALARASL
ncbi:MAG: Rpn family recombination-promoting nuclease/putative transposase [Thermoguttaceae bacterium]|nr:Rpn family recombination-promoting nuclease/putative transposase [Thermoguttaceae bacterium]